MGKETYTCSTCGTIYIADDGLGMFAGIVPADFTAETCSHCSPEYDQPGQGRRQWTQIIYPE